MIQVRHSRGEYPVRFQPLAEVLPAEAFVVTDQNVHAAWGAEIGPRACLVLPAGEQTKTLKHLGLVASWLVTSGASRGSTIVALGGGVIGDLVGFAAATYMRGVSYVQVPTTLLAQVDSSVGGKVAVDLPEGKNLVGAFYPPVAVGIDTRLIRTLPEREVRNGMAEVWKTALIMDADMAEWLVDPSEQVIERCIRHKARIVAEDEFETKGIRAILNFGHTVGHAIEQVAGYGTYLHGEAVSMGMVAEAKLGERLGVTPKGTEHFVSAKLRAAGLPVSMPPLDPEALLIAMLRDKKSVGGKLAFSLLTGIGGCKLVENVEEREVLEALKAT